MVIYTAILKVLYNCMVRKPTRQEIIKFYFENVQNKIFEISKWSKKTWNLPGQPDELTKKLATGKIAQHSWYSYVVTTVGCYYAEITEGFYCFGTPYLEVD